MERKITLGISLALLFVAFGFVSFLVIVTKRHPYFVGKKLSLGALIISLSGAAVGCFGRTCYLPVPENQIYIDQADKQTGEIILSRAALDTITGQITERRRNAFSCAITDSLDTILVKEDIMPDDGVFDENTEEFKIVIGQALVPGKYSLRFYTVPKDSIKYAGWYAGIFPLTITE